MLKVRIPATSANLGPGFDCLGLALNLYNTITVENNRNFAITLSGTYTSGISTDENNLVWQTMCHLWQSINFSIPSVALTLESNIPPARGLGSSSAAIVGGLIAANYLAGSPLAKLDLVQMATSLEGHPDNVTPALLGGITLSVPAQEGVLPRILARSPKLRAVVIIPDILVKTNKARSVLKPEVNRNDAVFNIAHVGLMVEAFLREDYILLGEGMRDLLHQNQRAALIPGLHDTLDAALEAGAWGSALSGSGPTIIALCPAGAEEKVGVAMLNALKRNSQQAQVYTLDIEGEGAILLD